MSTKILPLSTAPFPPNEYAPSSLSATHDNLLGKLYTDGTFVYQLVELAAEGAIEKKALKWASRSAHTVQLGSALTDDAAGIGPASMDIATTPVNSYVLMIVGGRATVTHSDDTTNTLAAARPFAIIDDDADTGKIRGVAAPKAGEKVLGRYISGTAADNADMVIEVDVADAPRQATALANVADSAAVTNTTTETAFDKTAIIHGSALAAGDVLHVRARVHVSSTNSTDTLTLKLYLGTEEICSTGAVDVANDDIGLIDAMIVVRTTGATAKVSASGFTLLDAAATLSTKFRKDEATEDLSAATTIAVKAEWSVASASNSCLLEDLIVLHYPAATPN